ncbi:hypothetical protein BDN72DRAFT_899484 [Pluteus cervinus]|uniref:Uncharacterized protein n=1 Tax=Pluteus cervinus TaxID=181527 RepID=A0ACD3AN02_9AGAR|nr:hypothetical protein BDN72DRAFT_899484 [Pluteus cervinus]
MTLSSALTFAFVLSASYFLQSNAQATHTVSVGIEGSFYDPSTVSAEENDVIQFIFGGDIHDVTQANFDLPCFPLEGGFHSGFLGRGPTFSNPPSVWNLIVTNASEPIWFFCATTSPTSHCASGMVGAINPPSIAEFNSFLSAAKLVTSQPALGTSPILTGVGATATGVPVTTNLPTIATITVSPSAPTTSSAPTASSTSPPSTSSSSLSTHTRDVIIGAVIGGVALLAILLISLWFCWRRNRNSDLSTTASPFIINQNGDRQTLPPGEFFSYRGNSPPILFEASVNGGERGMRQMGTLMNGTTGSATALNKDIGMSMPSTMSTGRSVASRPSQPHFTTERDSPLSAANYADIHRNVSTVLSPVRANTNGTVINPAYSDQTSQVAYEHRPSPVLPIQQHDQPQQPQIQYNRSDVISIYPQAMVNHLESPLNHNMTATQSQANHLNPQLTGTDGSHHLTSPQTPAALSPQASFLTHSVSTRSFFGHGSARQSPPPPLPPIPSGIVAPSPMVPGGTDVGQLSHMGTAGQLAQVGLGPSGPSSASTSSTNLNTLINAGSSNQNHATGNSQGNGQANPDEQMQGQDPSNTQNRGMQRNGSTAKSTMTRESGSIFSLMQSDTPAPPYQYNE